MEEVLLARKGWNNAAAFVSMDSNGKVRVYGKFYVEEGCRRRGYGGPVTEVLDTVPAHLIEEAKKMNWNTPRSQELGVFCENVFAKAKQVEPWFEYQTALL